MGTLDRPPTATQRRILENVAAGRAADDGRAFTQSAAAGWGCSIESCLRRGWLKRQDRPSYALELTCRGAEAIGLEFYGLSCWQEHRREEGQFNLLVPRDRDAAATSRRVEFLAGMAGWAIGHWDGQGHFACPECRGSLWDEMPLALREEYRPIIEPVAAFLAALATLDTNPQAGERE